MMDGTAEVAKRLQARLPSGWRASAESQPSIRRGGRAMRPDGLITIKAPDRRRSTVVVEEKARVEPLQVEAALSQARAYAAGEPLIFAPYLSPRTRERIVQLGGNYADA